MSLEEGARRWRFQGRRAAVLGALVPALGWGIAGAAALAAADQLLALPQPARLVFWSLGAAALAAAARGAWLAWRAADWSAAFAAAARRWPATRAMFASAWELRAPPSARGVSEELRLEHVARADRLAAELPPENLFPWSPSRAAKAGAAAAVLALALSAAAGARGSWRRVLWPWNDAPLDRFVVLLPGDASLDWGASTTVSARLTQRGAAAGVRPADLVLETRGGDGVWRVSAWDRVDAEAASFETGPLSGALDYRARRRDQATSARRLTPVAAPRFKAARAVVHGARGPKTFVLGEDAPVRARRGDWITVSGEPEAELASAALRLSSLQAPLPMRAGSGGSWSAGFPAQEDATLSFALVSADGRRDAAPPAYALAVLGDAKPAAELLSPQVPLQAGPREVIPIAYAARDDGALTKLELATRAQGKESRRALPLERGASEALGDAHLALKDYRPGVEVEFWIEAWDDASPPQGARSERGTVEIVDVDAAHAESLKARDAALAALDKAAEAAEAAAKAARSGDENAAREAARPVAGRMAAASGALMRWTQALAEDPRANPGLAEQADAAAQSLAEAAMEGLPKAESALAEKNLAAAAREQSALAEQARSAASALKEGSAVQNAQDMADRARGAERESADIERSLSALQSASPAELAELSKALAGVQEALEDLRKAVDALPEADPETSKVRDLPLDSARESAQKLQNALRSGDAAAAAKAARELAEKLSRVSKGLRESGMRSAQSRADKAKQGAGKVAQAWREAVAAQERAVESARRREAERQAGMLKEQKALVRRAQDEIESALSSSPPPEAERAARAAKQSLAQGRADDAARQLRQAAGACAAASANGGQRARPPSPRCPAFESSAKSLERGVPAPANDPAAAREAADAQTAAKAKTARLRGEVAEAAGALGFMPGGPLRRVDGALGEQESGESALRRGDSSEGLKRAEAALSILQNGEKGASGSEGSAGGMGEGMAMPFAMPGGAVRGAGRGSTGTGVGRVRLPSADEYRPPKELREELERSLRESRPAAHDSAIKEYFRRLTR